REIAGSAGSKSSSELPDTRPRAKDTIERKAPIPPVQGPKVRTVKEPEPLVSPPVLERGELREMRRLQQDVLGTGRPVSGGALVADPVPEPAIAEAEEP
ncbi:unnamed protein product, partial [Symbiodinium pilosum]